MLSSFDVGKTYFEQFKHTHYSEVIYLNKIGNMVQCIQEYIQIMG